jgi:catechol 2,3-dioxygenase-like lactoylglutathione lyase family enzyme
MRLRLELFVQSVPESRDFCTRVLGFDEASYQADGYSVYRLGDIQISLMPHANLPDDHPAKRLGDERAGLGRLLGARASAALSTTGASLTLPSASPPERLSTRVAPGSPANTPTE